MVALPAQNRLVSTKQRRYRRGVQKLSRSQPSLSKISEVKDEMRRAFGPEVKWRTKTPPKHAKIGLLIIGVRHGSRSDARLDHGS